MSVDTKTSNQHYKTTLLSSLVIKFMSVDSKKGNHKED